MDTTRRRFLEVYEKMLANKLFLESRTWTPNNFKPFDWHSYMAALSEQCAGPEAEIPEDFQMCNLKWPARDGDWVSAPIPNEQIGNHTVLRRSLRLALPI